MPSFVEISSPVPDKKIFEFFTTNGHGSHLRDDVTDLDYVCKHAIYISPINVYPTYRALPRLWHVSGNTAIFISRLTRKIFPSHLKSQWSDA